MQVRALVLPVLAFFPGMLLAQGASPPVDSLPFRRGQWAAQVSPNFAGGPTILGVLKFTSPRRAWVLDGQVTLSKGFFVRRDSSGATQDSVDMSTVAVNILVGRRFYRALAPHAVGFVTVGAGGGFSLDRSFSNTNALGWMVFGEIGASYHPIHELSLGIFASLDARYGDSKTTLAGSEKVEARGFGLTWRFKPIILTLYF